MTAELLLLRHGKSDWEVDTDDFHRPLKDRGKRGAQRMGVWLLQEGLIPDCVVSSPAERALVSAEKLCKAMGHGTKGMIEDRRVYDADLADLLAVLADCPPRARRLLLVGHNPGLETLLGYLADTELPLPEDGKLLPTATLARLSVPVRWNQLTAGCARLLSITRPADLAEKFPFPGPGSKDLRDRPAYYYSQSSVIPYRLHNGRLEILVILSSKKKHWVVPKGIKEPGLTPQQSAAQEAFEEAGVEGRVDDQPLGSYRYQKWGAECTVAVYPMEVEHVIPEQEWEERHRGRQWVSPKAATKHLKQPELIPLVQALAKRLSNS